MDDQLVDLVGAQVSDKAIFFAISDPFSAHFCYFCWLLEDLLFQKVSGTILEGTFEDFQGAKVQTTNKS